jgi:lipid-A-disaccharide synthase
VDSPAANFPICKIAQRLNRTVVHLVAPQLWAWGPWRIRKLRRCTDLVLCLLPFEETFFEKRGVPARFIGHPLFDETLDPHALDDAAAQFPRGRHKLAILPGSRPAELRRNFPVMLAAFRELKKEMPGLVGVVGATTETVREQLYETAKMLGGWPAGLDIEVAKTDAIVRWCDTSMVVSGTVTLQITKQRKPMVIMYKTNKLMYNLVGRLLITTPFFGLPNLIAGREVVPELIPYFKGHQRLVDAMRPVMTDDSVRAQQEKDLDEVAGKFDGLRASTEAADAIEEMFDRA